MSLDAGIILTRSVTWLRQSLPRSSRLLRGSSPKRLPCATSSVALRVALQEALPFDQLNLLRLDRPESFVLYVAAPDGSIREEGHRIVDSAESDSPADDHATRASSPRSARDRACYGALWATSCHGGAFDAEQQALLDAVADLLVLAFQRNAIFERDLHRRERIESLRGLLHTMAEALDIRSVFPQVSDVVRGGLPHDVLAITSWASDFSSYRIYALAGAQVDDPEFWAAKRWSAADREHLHAERLCHP